MKILVTNDDGIHSEGLLRLAAWAQSKGEVTVVAPAVEQSAKSHSINIHTPFAVHKLDILPGSDCYSVASTPADCVRYGCLGLGKRFDLVLSGVNNGYNIGQDIIYSGTVAAIFEAATNGVKAIAFSADFHNCSPAIEALDQIYAFFTERRLLEKGDIYNVNVPVNPKGICLTHQGGPYYRDTFLDLGDNLVQQKGHCVFVNHNDLSVDTDAVMSGYISVSPMTVDRTDYRVLDHIKE